jgi:hypothetical protein
MRTFTLYSSSASQLNGLPGIVVSSTLIINAKGPNTRVITVHLSNDESVPSLNIKCLPKNSQQLVLTILETLEAKSKKLQPITQTENNLIRKMKQYICLAKTLDENKKSNRWLSPTFIHALYFIIGMSLIALSFIAAVIFAVYVPTLITYLFAYATPFVGTYLFVKGWSKLNDYLESLHKEEQQLATLESDLKSLIENSANSNELENNTSTSPSPIPETPHNSWRSSAANSPTNSFLSTSSSLWKPEPASPKNDSLNNEEEPQLSTLVHHP